MWYYARTGKYTNTRDESTLVIGTNAEFPPFTYAKNGEIVGFDIDIIKEVAKRLGKKIVFKDMPFDSLIFEAIGGHIQAIAAGMTCTPEREKKLLFTTQYISGDPLVIITLKNKPKVNSIDDLSGKDVVVNEGFTADWHMTAHAKDVNLIRLATSAEAFMTLQSGRAYAYVAALNSLKPLFDKYGKEQFTITPIEGTNENCAIAVSKKFPELYEQIEKIIQEMIKDGTIEQLKTKWGIA